MLSMFSSRRTMGAAKKMEELAAVLQQWLREAAITKIGWGSVDEFWKRLIGYSEPAIADYIKQIGETINEDLYSLFVERRYDGYVKG